MTEPRWFWFTRRVITFALGVAVILDSLFEKSEASVGKLVVGLLLVGVPPIDDLIRMIGRNGRHSRQTTTETRPNSSKKT
jgi:hypothetical protein